jgi:hypothetical protein
MIMPLLGSGVLTKRQRVIPASFTGASFTGAYDAVPSITAAYGMRRLRTAYTGSILRLRRSSDNAEQDIDAVANGDLDTAAVSSFVGGGSGYIVNWYDQSGNGYTAAQATAASQPLYVASGQNGKPVGRWDGVNDALGNNAVALDGGNLTALVIADWRRAGVWNVVFSSGLTSNYDFAFWLQGLQYIGENTLNSDLFGVQQNATGGHAVYVPTFYHNSFSAFTLRRNGVSLAVSQQFGTSLNRTVGNGIAIGADYFNISSVGGYLNGDIAELIICNAALSTGDRTAAESAANAYWSIY